MTRHPERSAAKSRDPAKLRLRFATGFLDFARNDWKLRCGEQTARAFRPAPTDYNLIGGSRLRRRARSSRI